MTKMLPGWASALNNPWWNIWYPCTSNSASMASLVQSSISACEAAFSWFLAHSSNANQHACAAVADDVVPLLLLLVLVPVGIVVDTAWIVCTAIAFDQSKARLAKRTRKRTLSTPTTVATCWANFVVQDDDEWLLLLLFLYSYLVVLLVAVVLLVPTRDRMPRLVSIPSASSWFRASSSNLGPGMYDMVITVSVHNPSTSSGISTPRFR
mmetsp:Transcript_27870/g.61388  ORF Transcript_27870/g.61388 Transcript_27870/m.61388 type:complete len:209 (-) Transcript_27870:629-1255(-)